MMSARQKNYKNCMVPGCKNTTVKTPDKLFISVPKSAAIRKQWCRAMGRDEKKSGKLSSQSIIYCCEDHFNLEEDLENYMRFKLVGGNMRLRKNTVPHKFECQDGFDMPQQTEVLTTQESDIGSPHRQSSDGEGLLSVVESVKNELQSLSKSLQIIADAQAVANTLMEQQLVAQLAANDLVERQVYAQMSANTRMERQLGTHVAANRLAERQVDAQMAANTLTERQVEAQEAANALHQRYVEAFERRVKEQRKRTSTSKKPSESARSGMKLLPNENIG